MESFLNIDQVSKKVLHLISIFILEQPSLGILNPPQVKYRTGLKKKVFHWIDVIVLKNNPV